MPPIFSPDGIFPFCFPSIFGRFPFLGGGAVNWSAQAAETIRRRQLHHEGDREFEAESRSFLEKQGAIVWTAFCESVATLASDLNRAYGSQLIEPKHSMARRLDLEFKFCDRVTQVRIEFAPTTTQSALRWEYSGYLGKGVKHGSCHLYIRGNGEASFHRGLQFLRPIDLAEEILNGLIAE
jgi:hypothetical protein